LELPESSNPYTMELFTEGLKDQAAADDFAAWLDEEFFLDAAALDASTIQVELFSGMDSDIFMFDFTGYDAANVMLQGFRTSEVPEPSAWILFSLGVFGLAGFRTKKAPKVQAA
ncbi:MAG: PEP-CTERM sorting domain-containing protein, partial [Thermoguttaceae bacterium]|nr:PEP-CTERM sorting domain-containing protein [Thermoguttaceae bacterium]